MTRASRGTNLSSSTITVRAATLDGIAAVPSPGNSQPNQLFRFQTSPPSYQFNLSTGGLSPGTHTLTFTIGNSAMSYTLTFTTTQ